MRIAYLDALKVISIFAVVLIHTASPSLYALAPVEKLFSYANLLDSFSRFCVPVFFMASGAIFLSRDYEMVQFYKKRLLKIVPALLFWSVLYLAYRVFAKGEEFGVIDAVLMFFEGNVYYHLWFLYVITILYLLTPFIRRLIVNIDQKEALILFAVWFVVAILAPSVEGISRLKFGFPYGELGAYGGYFTLGYYLSRARFDRPIFAGSVFIIASTAIFYLTSVFSLGKNEFVSVFYDYSSLFVFTQAVSLFLLFKSILKVRAFGYIGMLAPLVFGVYLIHPLILEYSVFVDDLMTKALFVFLASLLLIWAMHFTVLRRVS